MCSEGQQSQTSGYPKKFTSPHDLSCPGAADPSISDFSATSKVGRLTWVIRVGLTLYPPLPVSPEQRTSTERSGWSGSCQQATSGRGRHTAAQRDGKRDQPQACQRKPDNRISPVLATRM